MRLAGLIFLAFVVFLAARIATACEPAHLKFEGTALADRALQIDADRIFFFRGGKTQIEITYRPARKKWCFQEASADLSRPMSGCFSRKEVGGKRRLMIDGKAVKNFIVRDENGAAVASLRVNGRIFTADFLGRGGKPLGKRLVFTSVTRETQEVLEVKGWNCPNARYLSCAGSELTSTYVIDRETPEDKIVPAADMGKNLGHYLYSCTKLTEHSATEMAKTKRAPSQEPR